ncbi:MAG: polysaccharide deacetylase family protein [Geminicoccaceae bacterium]|nr:polysaccharide deacetylase family protein [Geminicoccaceae bacterium]MDW8369517.1 polysaccharide deacetylase family protein [Geminicoccaceae bacterium]
MPTGAELAALLDALDRRPEPVRLWWRDDDAGRAHPRLDRLLGLARELDLPLALAVVPAWLEPAVAAAILATPGAAVLQHGWAHADRALAGERKIELGGGADRRELAALLGEGARRLEGAFGGRSLPVLVPPWNRIAPDVVAMLPGLGFRVLSIWDEGDLGPMPAGLARLDVHVDPIDWRGGRRWLGLAELGRRLALRIAAADRPIGLVTHHLVTEEPAWQELEQLLRVLRDHPRARLMPVERLVQGVG